MKTLLLLRHAKSSWDDPAIGDFDRPLAPRGVRDAPRIGKALKKRGPLPDLIISSPAARATQTIQAVVKSAGLEAEVQFDARIYAASCAELMRVIRQIPNSISCAMIVGHNPTFEDVVSRLAGSAHAMPTAALACIELRADRWDDIEDGEGKLVWLLTPKSIERD
ncbi:MAG TPA: histidine phosphatase family protein [Blastocatellia bacterium]|nr:histidine phosphatase family protein [Blastocatellia bacterium]